MNELTSDCQTWQIIISIITSFITAVSAIAVVIIAGIGLTTWRKQLKGTAEYELAKRLLRAVYKVRDTLNDALIRDMQINPGEIIELIKENTSKSKDFVENQNHFFERKLKSLSDALSGLDVESLQAEVLWGQNVKVHLKPFRANVNTFTGSVYKYLKVLNDVEPIAWYPKQMAEWDDSLRFVSGRDETFSSKIKESIIVIEDFIKPYMRI